MNLSRSVERIPSRAGGRQIMVIGAQEEEGTSSVAASLALLLSGRSARSTWLIDLDLIGNGQYSAFQGDFFRKTGRPGRAFDASLKSRPFYQVVPAVRTRNGVPQQTVKYLGVHQIDNTRLFVTHFRTELLQIGQKVQVNSTPDYWASLRKVTDWTVVDAPALQTSRAGLAVCRHMDGVIIVVRADETRVDQISSLITELESHGGHCLGVVANEVKADARFADRIAL